MKHFKTSSLGRVIFSINILGNLFNKYFVLYFQQVNMTMVEEVTLRSTLVSAGLEERVEEEEGRRMERMIMAREPREEPDSMAMVEHTLLNQHLVKKILFVFCYNGFFPILSKKTCLG